MSGLEIAALGLLGASYFDAKHRIFDDLYSIRNLIHATVSFKLAEKNHNLNMINVFNYWAAKRPNHPFLVYPEPIVEAGPNSNVPLEDSFRVVSYTYAEFQQLVMKYSQYLASVHNIKAYDVVALDFVNKPEFVIVWFALWNLGAVPSMINYNLQGKSLYHCVKISNAKLFVVDEEVADAGLAIADQLKSDENVPTIVADKSHFEDVFRNYKPKAQVVVAEKGSDPSCYIFTSGTTGLPKAANFSCKKAYYGSLLYGNVSFYSKDDILYSAMPLYHSTAAALGLMAILQKGGTYAIGHKFSTSTFWIQARLVNATSIQYVGETGRYLLNAPPSPNDRKHNVKVAHGNGMRPDVWEKFKERFGIPTISEFYGATEFPTAINNVQSGGFGVGACGGYGTLANFVLKRTKWNMVRIDPDTGDIYRDPSTGFAIAARPNEPGEFLFKVETNNVSADFQGYSGNKEATNEKLIHNVFKRDDTWVRSGDLLKYDENNHVYFVDRLGDTFRWKSENVSTNEVEEAISELGNIDLVVCVGVQVPKHEGRAGFAVVKLRDPTAHPDMKAWADYLLKRLPRYAVPIFIKFINDVHITGNNKIQKKLFRDQKIPAPPGETIWWLVGNEYKKLTPESWARVEQGQHKL